MGADGRRRQLPDLRRPAGSGTRFTAGVAGRAGEEAALPRRDRHLDLVPHPGLLRLVRAGLRRQTADHRRRVRPPPFTIASIPAGPGHADRPRRPLAGQRPGLHGADRPGRYRTCARTSRRRRSSTGTPVPGAGVLHALPVRGRELHQHGRAADRGPGHQQHPLGTHAVLVPLGAPREPGRRRVLLVRPSVPHQQDLCRPARSPRSAWRPTSSASALPASSPGPGSVVHAPEPCGARGDHHRDHLRLGRLLRHQPGHHVVGHRREEPAGGDAVPHPGQHQPDLQHDRQPELDDILVDQSTYTAFDRALPRGPALLAGPGHRRRGQRTVLVGHRGPSSRRAPPSS